MDSLSRIVRSGCSLHLRAAFSLRGDTMTEHRSGSLKHQSLGLELALGEVFGILDQNQRSSGLDVGETGRLEFRGVAAQDREDAVPVHLERRLAHRRAGSGAGDGHPVPPGLP